ncbi:MULTISPECIES: AAA family ATPase [unclassified Microbacterium]|uniref:AAA family ATPase n=1 Tax=unclassified Microbacterium TaxID=2609290 RepID=UPI003435853A
MEPLNPEQYVIGALMMRPAVLPDVVAECSPDDFADSRLGAILEGIVRLVAEHTPVDIVTVGDHLAAWDVRGIDFAHLSAWSSSVPTAANAGYYARMIHNAALTRGLRNLGGRIMDSQSGDVVDEISRAIAELQALRERGSSRRSNLITLRELLSVPEQEDEPDWVVHGLLERRDRLMLTGSEGGGKSTLLRQIAVCSAAGLHPFEHHHTRPVRTLVVDAENSQRQWRRAVRYMAQKAHQYGMVDPQDMLQLECTPRMDLTRAETLGYVHRLIDEAKPELLLIGPLYRLTPRAIKDDDDAAPLLAALDSLRERGVAMLIEAHAGHSTSAGGERDLRPRGSSALLGWPEFGLGLRRHREGRGRFQLVRWRGDRESREWPPQVSRGEHQIWPWERHVGA